MHYPVLYFIADYHVCKKETDYSFDRLGTKPKIMISAKLKAIVISFCGETNNQVLAMIQVDIMNSRKSHF